MSGWWASLPSYAPSAMIVQQRPQGRAGVLDLPILEVLAGDALLRLGDVVHAVHEGVEVLGLGPEELLVEDAVQGGRRRGRRTCGRTSQ